MSKSRHFAVTAGALALGLAMTVPAQAAVTEVEGAAGGGIVPWALFSGGKPTLSFTTVNTGSYSLESVAAQVNVVNWVEISVARDVFNAGSVVGGAVGNISLDVIGAKVKIIDMSDKLPALALGVQYKQTDLAKSWLTALGADTDKGTDVYLAATKVFAIGDHKLLLNGTVRATKANQIGLLGFGSTRDNSYQFKPEVSVGYFVNANTVVGAEYRAKPDNINYLSTSRMQEENWYDMFIAYFPSKEMSITMAYANLGNIATGLNSVVSTTNESQQRGLYLQMQVNF